MEFDVDLREHISVAADEVALQPPSFWSGAASGVHVVLVDVMLPSSFRLL